MLAGRALNLKVRVCRCGHGRGSGLGVSPLLPSVVLIFHPLPPSHVLLDGGGAGVSRLVSDAARPALRSAPARQPSDSLAIATCLYQ